MRAASSCQTPLKSSFCCESTVLVIRISPRFRNLDLHWPSAVLLAHSSFKSTISWGPSLHNTGVTSHPKHGSVCKETPRRSWKTAWVIWNSTLSPAVFSQPDLRNLRYGHFSAMLASAEPFQGGDYFCLLVLYLYFSSTKRMMAQMDPPRSCSWVGGRVSTRPAAT